MPLKLYPPLPPKNPNWRIRGTYLRRHINQSTGTGDEKLARRILRKIQDDIERGAYTPPAAATFADVALTYMQGGGEARFLKPLLLHFKDTPVEAIDQLAVDRAAIALLPDAPGATRNRQVYTPVSAVLKAAGIERKFRRPKGARSAPRMHWLRPEQAFALIHAANAQSPRFGAFLTFLLYTGCRLNEACDLKTADLNLVEGYAYVRKTKNGEPRLVHLPPVVVAALANIERGDPRVFGWHKSGRLYTWLQNVEKAAGVHIPDGIAFHIFRHTYGAWMRRYNKLDTSGLVATGAWKSRDAAQIYEHVEASEEARKADFLPVFGGKP